MFRNVRFCLMGILLGLLCTAAAHTARSADDKAAGDAKSGKKAAAPAENLPQTHNAASPSPSVRSGSATGSKDLPAPPKVRELSPAAAALCDQMRRTLATLRQQPFNTRENTVGDMLHFCLAFGCQTEVHDGSAAGQAVNGITCVCWNMPCAGYEPLMLYDNHLAPRVGFGYQETPSQMAAMLAMSRVPINYPARSGETTRTVADLIEHEKLSCRAGADQSLRLLALAYYVQEPSWKNSLGEEWSVGRLLKEELARSVAGSPQGMTNRLLALSWAVQRRAQRNLPIDDEFFRAKKYIDECHSYVLRIQNADGSWGQASNRDYAGAIGASGRVLEWLALSLPDSSLEDPQVVKAVEYLNGLLGSSRYQWNVHALSPREIGAVMHAAHALALYNERVFVPADPPAEELAPKPGAAAAEKHAADNGGAAKARTARGTPASRSE